MATAAARLCCLPNHLGLAQHLLLPPPPIPPCCSCLSLSTDIDKLGECRESVSYCRFFVSLFAKSHVYVALMHNHKMLSHALRPRRGRRPPTCAVSIQFFGKKRGRLVTNVRDICSMLSRTRFWWLLSSFQLTFARFTDR